MRTGPLVVSICSLLSAIGPVDAGGGTTGEDKGGDRCSNQDFTFPVDGTVNSRHVFTLEFAPGELCDIHEGDFSDAIVGYANAVVDCEGCEDDITYDEAFLIEIEYGDACRDSTTTKSTKGSKSTKSKNDGRGLQQQGGSKAKFGVNGRCRRNCASRIAKAEDRRRLGNKETGRMLGRKRDKCDKLSLATFFNDEGFDSVTSVDVLVDRFVDCTKAKNCHAKDGICCGIDYCSCPDHYDE